MIFFVFPKLLSKKKKKEKYFIFLRLAGIAVISNITFVKFNDFYITVFCIIFSI